MPPKLNRMQQTAIEVLKPHERAITLDRGGDMLRIHGVPGREAVQELRAALFALHPEHWRLQTGFVPATAPDTFTVTLSGEPQLVRKVASLLADHGINFPGSAALRSPQR